MAKNDYFHLVCQILIYLYRRLKKKTTVKPEDFLKPGTKELPIDEEYFLYILDHMLRDELIEDVTLNRAWGKVIIGYDVSNAAITPKGIAYLGENSVMRKIAQIIPEAADIASMFIP